MPPKRKFRDVWLRNDEFKDWLCRVDNKPNKAHCCVCHVDLPPEISALKRHKTSHVHNSNVEEKATEKQAKDVPGVHEDNRNTSRRAEEMTKPPHKCGICKMEYNEDLRSPRILVCSHTFCTSCLQDLIGKNDHHCPSCDLPLIGDCIEDMTVNLCALEFIRYLESLEPRAVADNKEEESDRATRQRNDKTNWMLDKFPSACDHQMEQCQEAQEQVKELISEVEHLQESITKENTRLELKILPRLKSVVLEYNWLLEDLRQTNLKMHNHKTTLSKKALEIMAFKEEMAAGITDKLSFVDESCTAFRCINEVKRKLSEEKERLEIQQKKAVKITENVKQFLETQSLGENEVTFPTTSSSGGPQVEEELAAVTIQAEDVQAMGPQIRQSIKKGKLFAVQIYGERRRYAKISFTRERQIFLHHLTDDPLPQDAWVVEFDELVRLADPSSTLAFLQLKSVSNEKILGDILIRISTRNLRAKNFCLLCTGEMGPTYANTKLLKSKYEGTCLTYVRFGDYESNDGTGGMSLLAGTGDDNRSQEWNKGTVRGIRDNSLHDLDSVGSQFDIYGRKRNGKFLNYSFGMVEEGMHIVNEAARLSFDTDIVINECGIVIPSA